LRKRLVGLVCVVWALVAVTVVFGAGRARAAAPRDQGWWTVTSLAVPGAPVAIPGPPDVPARGLVVQGGGGGAPTAYSALLYELDPGTTASSLSLAVAPNTVTTPGAMLQVCGLLQPINHPEQGGPLTDAPPYNCGRQAKAAPTGNTYKFDVSGMVVDNLVAVAILPTGPTDRVVLNAPDDSSLTTTQGGSSDTSSAAVDTSGGTGSSDTVPVSGGTSDVATGSAPIGSSVGGDATAPVSVDQPTIAVPAPAVTPSNPASNLPFLPTATAGTEKATPLAVILLVAAVLGGVALWAFAGQPRSGAALP
jgi:hypothetical protein